MTPIRSTQGLQTFSLPPTLVNLITANPIQTALAKARRAANFQLPDGTSVKSFIPKVLSGLALPSTAFADSGLQGLTSLATEAYQKGLFYSHELTTLLYQPEYSTATTGISTALITALITHKIQTAQAEVIPVLFSGIESVKNPDTPAKFYAAVNDVAMFASEAWNARNSRKSTEVKFHEILNVNELLNQIEIVKTQGEKYKSLMSEFYHLRNDLASAINHLNDSWSYTTYDNYRTEIYYETVTDSKGNSRQEMRTKQVYESTDHTYHYYAGEAQAAREDLLKFFNSFRKYNSYQPEVEDHRVSIEDMKHAEYELIKHAIIHTVLEDDDAQVTREDVENFLNMWITGTDVDVNLDAFIDQMIGFEPEMNRRFSTVFNSNSYYSYRTKSRSDSGPSGYQEARNMEYELRNAYEIIDTILDNIQTCIDNAETIENLIKTQLHGSEEIASDFDDQVMGKAIESYLAVFPESRIKMDQMVSNGKTAAIALAVGAVVSILTYVFHPESGVIHY